MDGPRPFDLRANLHNFYLTNCVCNDRHLDSLSHVHSSVEYILVGEMTLTVGAASSRDYREKDLPPTGCEEGIAENVAMVLEGEINANDDSESDS